MEEFAIKPKKIKLSFEIDPIKYEYRSAQCKVLGMSYEDWLIIQLKNFMRTTGGIKGDLLTIEANRVIEQIDLAEELGGK